MVFPREPLGLRGYLLINGQWVRVSPAPYTRDPITHKRGRPYRANAADPTEATATFQNRDGRYSSRNAEGPYYGLLPRNTPFKVVVPGGDAVHLELTGGTDRATTPDAAAIDITGSIDVRYELKLDNQTDPRGIILGGKWQISGNQRSWLVCITGAGGIHFRRSTDGTGNVVFHESPALPATDSGRIAIRTTWNATNSQHVHYWAPTIAGPWTQLGISTAGSSASLVNTSAPLTVGDIDQVTAFARPDGNVYKFELRSGIGGTLVANADFTAQTVEATSFTDGTGLVWTLAGAALITDRVTRFDLEIPEWPARWSTSEADAWTSVEAAGILRRLSQGQKPLDSALRRRVPSGNPIAYWPCEDGANASQFYSPITGVRPLTTSGMQLASDDSLAGSSALPTIQGGATIAGTVPAPAVTPTQWHTEFVYKTPGSTLTGTARTAIQWLSTGTVRRWRLMLRTATAEIYGYDSDDTEVVSQTLDLSAYPQMFGNWVRWKLHATESAGTVSWTVAWTVVGVSGASFTGSYSGTAGRISGIRGPDGGYSSDLNGMAIGHFTVVGTANSTLLNSADTGFDGETAGARLQRLCAEEGIGLKLIGDAAGTQRVGPQRPAALLDLLRAAAEADGGIFGESRTRRQLQYRTRVTLYNQVPKLTLNYASKEVATPLAPVEDDQARNEWTVEREGGSSAVATLAAGPLSIADIGYYPDSATLSLFSDDQTDHIAGWLLHLTTWDEARWPSVTLRLHRHPEFIPSVLAMDVGDKIRIENLPKKFAGGGAVELLVDSWEETLLPRKWEITFNCGPAGPWSVAELAVFEDFEDTAYEISWADGGTLPWLRTSAQAHTGTWSLRSGAISGSQTSDAVVAVPSEKTELRFWYWTSSQAAGPGVVGDPLLVLVDGVEVLRAQGTTPWAQAIVPVEGATSVTFRYAKDASTSSGSDFVAIDNVSFTGRGPCRGDTEGSALVSAVTATDTSLLVATTRGPQWTGSPVQFPFDLLIAGEVVRAMSAVAEVRDTFGRTLSGQWGTADSGLAWGVAGGTVGTDYTVGSGYGAHVLTTTNASRRSSLAYTLADVDVYVSVTTSATATGGSLYGGPAGRYVDADNMYFTRIEFTTGNAVLVDLRKRTGAVESSLGTYTTGLTHAAGTYVRCRLQVVGSAIRTKVWPASAPEPPEWHVDVVDTSVTTSTFVGTRSISAAANSNSSPQVRYDDFEVLNFQRFTVARSTNLIVKPQSAGTAVRLAPAAYAAL
ncbi:hypothetical protein ACWD3Z_05610 [Streptomyces sp. NPDC002740]